MWRASSPLLGSLEAFFERYFFLEHGANIFPIGHVLTYFTVFALLAVPGLISADWLRVPLWLVLVANSYSLSIGVLHMHGHRKLFTSRIANRVLEFLLCVPCVHTYVTMRYAHVYLHHKFADGPGDPTSTRGWERGWRPILYWLRYAPHSKIVTMRAVFAKDAKTVWRRMRVQFLVDTLGVIALAVLYLHIDPMGMIWLWLIPLFIVSTNIGFFAWLTHAPAFRGDMNGSFNTSNRCMNFFIHNQGYHVVHHRYPGIHWTSIPDKFDVMLRVDDRLTVPYWVFLPSAWRLAIPQCLRDPDYARNWKCRYLAKRPRNHHRMPWLPYFGWV